MPIMHYHTNETTNFSFLIVFFFCKLGMILFFFFLYYNSRARLCQNKMHAFVTVIIVNVIVLVFTVYKKIALFVILLHAYSHFKNSILFLLLLLEKKKTTGEVW